MQPMEKTFTKAEAKELFGAKTDTALADAFGVTRQAMNKIAEDEVLSGERQWQIRCLIAEGKLRPPQAA